MAIALRTLTNLRRERVLATLQAGVHKTSMATPGEVSLGVSLAGGAVCLFVWGVTWQEYQLRMHEIRQDIMLLTCMSFFWSVLYYSATSWRNTSTQEIYITSGLPELNLPELPIQEQKLLKEHVVQIENLSEDQVVATGKYQGMYNSNLAMEEVGSERHHGMYNPNWTLEDNDESAVLSPGAKESMYLGSTLLCHLLLILLNILHMERLLRYLCFLYREEEGVVNTRPTLTQNLILFTPLCVIFVNVSMSVVFLLQLLLTKALRSPSRQPNRLVIRPV